MQAAESRLNRNSSRETGHVSKECQSSKTVNVCQQQVNERSRSSTNFRVNTGSVVCRKTFNQKEALRIGENCGNKNTRFKGDEEKCYNLRNWVLKCLRVMKRYRNVNNYVKTKM